MDEDVLEDIPVKTEKGKKKKGRAPVPDKPKNINLEAAHRKFMMVMIGIFVAILVVMLLMQGHVDFAMDGGM
jgi:hypothetical protein